MQNLSLWRCGAQADDCKESDAAKESVFADQDPIQGRRPLQKGSTRQVGYNSRGQVTRSGGVCPL